MEAQTEEGAVYVENTGRRYRVQTLADFRRFRNFAFSEEGWKEHYKKQDPFIHVQSRQDPTTKLTIFRVTREMPNVAARTLYDNLHDADYRRTWDNNMIDGYNICSLNAHNDIGYYSVKFPWPLTNRDFCNMRSWMEFTNGEYVIFNHTVPHNDCPPYKKFVRGTSHLTGYYIQPRGKGCVLTYITHTDVGGSIPKTITDMALNKKVPDIMRCIEECAQRYVGWSAKEYPPGHVHAWSTPKMDWSSAQNYPTAAARAAEAAALAPATGSASAAGPAAGPAALLSGGGGGGGGSCGQEAVMSHAGESVRAANAAAVLEAQSSGVASGGDGSKIVELEKEIAELRRKLLLASTATVGGKGISLAPVAPAAADDTADVQRFRAIVNDIANSIDRQFIQEGRVPTSREYLTRFHYALEGIKCTMAIN